MVENQFLVNRNRVFKGKKYIVVIEEERAEDSFDSWEGRV